LELVLLHSHQWRNQIFLSIPRYITSSLILLGVSDQVKPKTHKAPAKKIGEEEPHEERRGYGERRGSKFLGAKKN